MSATGGIVLFYSSLFILISRSKKLQRLPKEIKQILALTLSAQIFTTPLLLIFFREYPLLSIPINLVVSFFVEPIMVFGILLSLLSLLGPIITFPLSLILFGLLQTLLTIISWLGHLSALFVLRI
jgi:competence protein ComEC